jgi:hypothetical protein
MIEFDSSKTLAEWGEGAKLVNRASAWVTIIRAFPGASLGWPRTLSSPGFDEQIIVDRLLTFSCKRRNYAARILRE